MALITLRVLYHQKGHVTLKKRIERLQKLTGNIREIASGNKYPEVISNEDVEQLVHYLKDEIGQSLSLPLDEKIELCFDTTCTSLPEEPDQVQLTPTGPELMDISGESSNVDEQKHDENANFRKEFVIKKQRHYETTAVESNYADQLVNLETPHVQKTMTGLKPEDVWIDNSYSSDEKIPSTCVKVDSSDNNTARNRLHTEDNIVTLNEEAAEIAVKT
jgi:hypothetical protein